MPDSELESSWHPKCCQRVIPCFKNYVAVTIWGTLYITKDSKIMIIIRDLLNLNHIILVLKSYIYYPQFTTAALPTFNIHLVSVLVLNSNMRWPGGYPQQCSTKRVVRAPRATRVLCFREM